MSVYEYIWFGLGQKIYEKGDYKYDRENVEIQVTQQQVANKSNRIIFSQDIEGVMVL